MYELYGQRDDGTVKKLGWYADLEAAQTDFTYWSSKGLFRKVWIQ